MAGRDFDHSEEQAAVVVAALLGGKVEPRDTAISPAGTHDWDICTDNGRIVALEVTSAKDEVVYGFMRALGDQVWQVDDLHEDWHICISHPVRGVALRVSDLRREICGLLRILNAAEVFEIPNIEEARWRREKCTPDVFTAIGHLHDRGVSSVKRLGPPIPPSGPAILVSVSHGFASEPEAINAAVAREAEANAKKLLAAAADERHLFVWIDGSTPEMEFAMFQDRPPLTGPDVTQGIDVVWVATMGTVDGRSRIERLWRSSPPPTPWVVIAAPAAEELDRPEQG